MRNKNKLGTNEFKKFTKKHSYFGLLKDYTDIFADILVIVLFAFLFFMPFVIEKILKCLHLTKAFFYAKGFVISMGIIFVAFIIIVLFFIVIELFSKIICGIKCLICLKNLKYLPVTKNEISELNLRIDELFIKLVKAETFYGWSHKYEHESTYFPGKHLCFLDSFSFCHINQINYDIASNIRKCYRDAFEHKNITANFLLLRDTFKRTFADSRLYRDELSEAFKKYAFLFVPELIPKEIKSDESCDKWIWRDGKWEGVIKLGRDDNWNMLFGEIDKTK